MVEDEVFEAEPLNPRFEVLAPCCNLIVPKAVGCECQEWAPVAPVIPLRAAA